MSSIIELIRKSASEHPDLIAISSGDNKLSYRELLEGIDNAATNILASGALPGDKFLYAAKQTPQSMCLALGFIKAGLTLAFVDPFTSDELFKSRVDMVQPKWTLANPLLYTIGRKALSPARKIKSLTIADFSSAATNNLYTGGRWLPGVPLSAKSVDNWLKIPGFPVENLLERDENEESVIVFTSGTTSDPKGVVHTSASLAANVFAFAKRFGMSSGQVIYSEPMTLGVTALSVGAEWKIPQKGEIVPDCDVYFAVPTEVVEALDKLEELFIDDRPNVKIVGTGAAPVLPSLVKRIYSVLGKKTKVLGVYGMTEMLPIAIVDGKQKLEYSEGDLVGTLIGDAKVKIADDGEVLIQGSGLMKSYLGKEPQEWHPTGDIGKMVGPRKLALLGRKKNMFIRGNMNIYPGLYEPALSSIEGVSQAIMVGLDDYYGDDYIVLAVTPEDSSVNKETLRQRVNKEMSRHVDGDAVPDKVIVIDKMPVSGRALKINRDELKELMIKELSNENN